MRQVMKGNFLYFNFMKNLWSVGCKIEYKNILTKTKHTQIVINKP